MDLAYEVATRDEVINHYFDSIQELATEEIRKNPESIVDVYKRQIDGTNNFVTQKEDFAVMVAYFEDGIGQFGLIYDVCLLYTSRCV